MNQSDEHLAPIRGICEWCCNPVQADDSFFQREGIFLHQNNARPSCCASYGREAGDLLADAE